MSKMKILDEYDTLRAYEVPMLKCGKTVVPATKELPGFLQAAILLAENIDTIGDCKQRIIALRDVRNWIKYLQEEGSETIGQLDKWLAVANLLRKNVK